MRISDWSSDVCSSDLIDVAKRLIARYPKDMMLAANSAELEKAMKAGKIAGMLGMEGGQSIGSSLAVLRQMYDLGARYMTLTHGRNTPWADSATDAPERSEEHTSELQSLMRISYAVFCLKNTNHTKR